MIRPHLLPSLIVLATCCSGRTQEPAAPHGVVNRWQAPPLGKPARRTPRLVNYCHINRELEHHSTRELEALLAQWDVVILYPVEQIYHRQLVSLQRIRALNPKIRLLVWMPLQGPSGPRWLSTLSDAKLRKWSGRDTSDKIVLAPWGERLMNPVADDGGWPAHVVDFLETQCLGKQTNRFDGALLDCLWTNPASGIDANQDGQLDRQDDRAWREAYLGMLRRLREKYPQILLVGNAGGPLKATDPYLRYLNGSLHENALGNQWGPASWQSLWDGYQATLQASRQHKREAMHLIVSDVRMNRTMEDAQQLTALTDSDLQRMRYGLCTSMLMDGGYFGFDRGDCLHGQLWWFPEYEINIGPATGEYQFGRLGPGVYSRQFECGLVVVNTSDSSVTVDLDRDHTDCSYNVTSRRHIVPPQDGRILRLAEPSNRNIP